MTYSVLQGDVRDVLTTLEGESFDAMLTDPPYGLEFMGVAWDTFREGGRPRARNEWGDFGSREHARTPDERQRIARKKGVAFQEFTEAWAIEALRVLKPGAFALVFGGTRTFHRLAVALEDAGFEMRDTLMWVYGSGFPKSHNLKGEWEGYGTALKPAWEPALLVRKPSPLTFAEGALTHGCGALNIDGTRVPIEDGDAAQGGAKSANNRGEAVNYAGGGYDGEVRVNAEGRWPANLIHDGSDEVTDLFPYTKGKVGMTQHGAGTNSVYGTFKRSDKSFTQDGVEDEGSAARFFYTAKASTNERDAGLEGRNPHPTVKPLALTEYLARLLLPPPRDTPRRILVPFAGSGSEVIGALKAGWDEAVGIEREEEYVAIAEARLAHWTKGIQLGLAFLEAV